MTKELVTKYGPDNKLTFGSDGWLYLLDVMGDDDAICDAARVSYGAGTRAVSSNQSLIRYLVNHNHTSPLEQARIKIHIRLPIYIDRQFQKHRTAHFTSQNEYSQRYSFAIDSMETTKPNEWRLQDSLNKQGSSGILTEWPEDVRDLADQLDIPEDQLSWLRQNWLHATEDGLTPGEYLSRTEAEIHSVASLAYKERLLLGVAREQARKDLPLSTYTEKYWTIDLANLLWLLKLRLDPHAQKEIRELADCIATIVKEWCPIVWDAFEDYKVNSIQLSTAEITALASLLNSSLSEDLNSKPNRAEYLDELGLKSKAERIAFINKLKLIESSIS